jgi:hypothetical protein
VPRSIRIAASLGLLAALAATTSCGSSAATSAPAFGQAARVVPANSLAFFDVDLDRNSDGWRNLTALGARVPGFAGMVAKLQADLARTGADGQSFDTAVRPWLGDEAAVAVTSIDISSGRPKPVIEAYVAVKDEGALEHVLSTGSQTAKDGSTGGYTLYRERSGSMVAGVGSGALLLASSPAALQQEIALRNGRGAALAGNPTYRRVLADLPGSRIVTGFLDPAQLANLLGLATALEPQTGGSSATLSRLHTELAQLPGVGLSASVDTGGLRFASVALVSGGAAQQMTAPGYEPALLQQVPAGALAFADVHGSPAVLSALQSSAGLTGLATMPAGVPVPPRARIFGLALHDALPVLTGEFAFDVVPGPGADLLATPAQPASAAAGLERLFSAVARLVPQTSVAHVPGGEQLVLPHAAGAKSIGWRRSGGLFVVGTDPSTARPAATLAGNPAFTALLHTAGVPTTVGSLVYLNVPGLANLSSNPPAGLRALGGLVAWTQVDPGRLTGEIYLAVP